MSDFFDGVVEFFTGNEAREQNERATRLAEQQERARQRMAEVDAERARKRALRESTIARGTLVNTGAAAGVMMSGTSSIVGGLGSLSSQGASNIASINREQGGAKELGNLGTQIAEAQNKAYAAQSKAAAVGNIFSLATSAYSAGKK